MSARVALFVDYQNVYMTAREAFCRPSDPSSFGQIDPSRLAQLICDRALPPGAEIPRIVSDVRVYAGRPSQHRDPKGYAAARRQTAYWIANGGTVIERTLRYPPNYPTRPAQEKGIDVSLAIDFVAGAVDGAFDVGIIFSTDTDLVPALELVLARPGLGVTAEVAAWHTVGANRPLRVSGQNVWCHRLEESDYRRAIDKTVYVR